MADSDMFEQLKSNAYSLDDFDCPENRQNRGIYALIFNTDSGEKIYIGSTAESFHGRLRRHLGLLRNHKHPNPHLQNLWDVYHDFHIVIVEKCSSPEGLTLKEQSYIDAVPYKMRINYGPAIPSPRLGTHHTSDTRKILSEKTKAARAAGKGFLQHTAESRAKISSARKGKSPSEATKRARLAKYAGKPLPEEWRRHIKEAMNKPEVLAKISATSKGRIVSDETRAKMSRSQKARPPMGKEQRQKLSIWHTGKTLSPEARAKISAAKKGRKLHPLSQETKDKISRANKAAYVRKKATGEELEVT